MNDQELLDLARQKREAANPDRQDNIDALATGMAMLNFAAALTEAGAEKETEYLDEETGLLRCRVCGGPRQTIITPPFEGAQPRTVRCWCKCPTQEDRRKARERAEEIDRRRQVCFAGIEKYKGWTFAEDSRKKPELSALMQQYAELFPQYLRDGKGLLLYGDTGTGKSCFSAMIANAVLDKGYRARMINFEQIEKELWDAEQKAVYTRELLGFDLLVLDDLGVERKNDYMQGIVYNVIDGRVRQGLPVVVTTNLTTDEFSKADEMAYKRIYERIMHKCTPVNVAGVNYRRAEAGQMWIDMRKQLGMEV